VAATPGRVVSGRADAATADRRGRRLSTLQRERKKLRKTFPTLAAAKSWRADATAAANRGTLRSPTTTTVKEAADAFLSGAHDGSIPGAGGGRYKPSTLRGYQVGLKKRVLPALGTVRLSDVRRRDVLSRTG
jgi:hypothetical protein